jgi:hypothetical protein
MRLTTIAAVACLLIAMPAFAQFAPSIPSNPKDNAECNAFVAASKRYLDQLHEIFSSCSRAYNHMSVTTWQPGFSCSNHVKVPVPCVPSSNAWTCAIKDFGAQQKQCFDAARRAEDAAGEKRKNDLDAELKKALLDTTDGNDKVGADMAGRLAKWWSDRYGDGTFGALSKSLKIAGYANAAQSLRLALGDSSLDPAQRALNVAGALNQTGNLISREMTRDAINGTASAGRSAISALDAELSRFGLDVSMAAQASDAESRRKESQPEPEPELERRPREQPEWVCFPEYDQCVSYCQQRTGGTSTSGWCGGICSDNGTRNRPKPSEFGDSLCYHAPVTAQERSNVR